MLHFILSVLFFLNLGISSNPELTLTPEEKKLYKIITEYRQQHNLPKIPLYRTLTYVAKLHVRDLHQNRPEGGKCNMHSWSDKGKWSACCYTDDHENAECMWNKPRELTTYKGNGYEIAYGAYGFNANADGALKGWKGSPGHNQVILNQGIWKDADWKGMGVGIYGGYAVVWFGEVK